MTSPLSSAPGRVAVITGGGDAIGTATAYPAIAASFNPDPQAIQRPQLLDRRQDPPRRHGGAGQSAG
jgi:hypothetical protein